MTVSRIDVVYRLRVEPEQAAHRARLLAVEQSIEMPPEAVGDARVLDQVLASVERIEPQADGSSLAHLRFASETVCEDAGQLMNVLFGNCSLQPEVELVDLDLPPPLKVPPGVVLPFPWVLVRGDQVWVGSAETTFYVIAVYLGAVGIRKSKYLVPVCLTADLVGIIVAVLVVKLLS